MASASRLHELTASSLRAPAAVATIPISQSIISAGFAAMPSGSFSTIHPCKADATGSERHPLIEISQSTNSPPRPLSSASATRFSYNAR